MKVLSSICTALMILSFILLFGIGNSEGFEIEVMKPSFGDYYDYSGYLYHSAYVKTSEPYYAVSWYLNGKYVGCSGGEADDIEAFFAFDSYAEDPPGSPHGKTYTLKAEAWSIGTIDNPSVKATKSYNVTVYSVPKTDDRYGNHTFAHMKGSVDVGWNGTKAETTADGYISTEMPLPIVYGINIRYAVGLLTRGDPIILDQPAPPLPINIGVISKDHQFFESNASQPYSDTYELPNGGNPGSRYYVEAKVTITAQYPQFPNNQDELTVEDREELSIPRD